MLSRESVKYGLAAGLLFVGWGPGRSHAQQPPTLSEVIQGLEQAEKLFFDHTSLYLRYERTNCQDVIPTTYSGGLLPAVWTLAYRGDKWFLERRFTQAMERPAEVVPGKPKKPRMVIPTEPKTNAVRGRVMLNWDQDGKFAAILHFDQNASGNIYAGLLYPRNLSLDAPRYVALSEGLDVKAVRKKFPDDAGLPFLPEYLRQNKGQYRVRTVPEMVDGMRCWVVEWPGMDRFWVAPDRGFAVPRRQYCWGPGQALRYEFAHRDYREVKPGLWVPFTQLETKYASVLAEKEALWGQVAARAEYQLHAVEFDKVPEALFDVKLPVGTKVIDTVRHLRYTVSDEAEPLGPAIVVAKEELRRASLRHWGLVAGGTALVLVLGGAIVVYARRRFRVRNV
jgi:hypothetical protein